MYKLYLTNRFQKSFEKLSQKIKLKAKIEIRNIHQNPYIGKRLTGDLEGEFSYRIGKYSAV